MIAPISKLQDRDYRFKLQDDLLDAVRTKWAYIKILDVRFEADLCSQSGSLMYWSPVLRNVGTSNEYTEEYIFYATPFFDNEPNLPITSIHTGDEDYENIANIPIKIEEFDSISQFTNWYQTTLQQKLFKQVLRVSKIMWAEKVKTNEYK